MASPSSAGFLRYIFLSKRSTRASMAQRQRANTTTSAPEALSTSTQTPLDESHSDGSFRSNRATTNLMIDVLTFPAKKVMSLFSSTADDQNEVTEELEDIELDSVRLVGTPVQSITELGDRDRIVFKDKARHEVIAEMVHRQEENGSYSPRSPDDDQNRDFYGFAVDSINAVLLKKAQEISKPKIQKQRVAWQQYLQHVGYKATRVRKDSYVKIMVRHGIPPELRGQLWQILSGVREYRVRYSINYTEIIEKLPASNKMYDAQIEKDLQRTFPGHELLNTPTFIDSLRRVLCTFACIRPEVGYCQSMNYVVATLLLFMSEEEAFWMLCHLIDNLLVASFYSTNLFGVNAEHRVLQNLLQEKLPRIHAHFASMEISLESITMQWFLCLFVNVLPFETTMRIWDIFFFEGNKILLRMALALFKILERNILEATTLTDIMSVFQQFPKRMFLADEIISVAWDSFWIGSFNQNRIENMRRVHREKLQLDIMEMDERRRRFKEAKLKREKEQQRLRELQGNKPDEDEENDEEEGDVKQTKAPNPEPTQPAEQTIENSPSTNEAITKLPPPDRPTSEIPPAHMLGERRLMEEYTPSSNDNTTPSIDAVNHLPDVQQTNIQASSVAQRRPSFNQTPLAIQTPPAIQKEQPLEGPIFRPLSVLPPPTDSKTRAAELRQKRRGLVLTGSLVSIEYPPMQQEKNSSAPPQQTEKTLQPPAPHPWLKMSSIGEVFLQQELNHALSHQSNHTISTQSSHICETTIPGTSSSVQNTASSSNLTQNVASIRESFRAMALTLPATPKVATPTTPSFSVCNDMDDRFSASSGDRKDVTPPALSVEYDSEEDDDERFRQSLARHIRAPNPTPVGDARFSDKLRLSTTSTASSKSSSSSTASSKHVHPLTPSSPSTHVRAQSNPGHLELNPESVAIEAHLNLLNDLPRHVLSVKLRPVDQVRREPTKPE